MDDTIVSTIDLASVFKEFVRNNPDIKFADSGLRQTILDSEDNSLLRVTKSIGSIKIIKVKLINDEDIISEVLG